MVRAEYESYRMTHKVTFTSIINEHWCNLLLSLTKAPKVTSCNELVPLRKRENFWFSTAVGLMRRKNESSSSYDSKHSYDSHGHPSKYLLFQKCYKQQTWTLLHTRAASERFIVIGAAYLVTFVADITSRSTVGHYTESLWLTFIENFYIYFFLIGF